MALLTELRSRENGKKCGVWLLICRIFYGGNWCVKMVLLDLKGLKGCFCQ